MRFAARMVRTSGKLDQDGALIRVGAAIRARRLELGVSQEALADSAKVDRSHMGKIERGERNVTLLLLQRVAAALNIAVHRLLEQAGV